jgi:hypothetical protein
MRVRFKRFAITTARKLALIRFHRHHAIQASAALEGIEKRRGRTAPALIKQADAYARDVFGSVAYAPWLRVYAAFNGRFKEGWIPDNYYGAVVVPRTKGWYGELSTLKSISAQLFRDPALPDLAYLANGALFSSGNVAIPDNEARDILFSDTDRVVYKPDHSSQGRGILFLDRDSFEYATVRKLGNGVFQRFVRQHEVFDGFAPGAVATLRLTTVVERSGEISLRSCFLRLGRVGDTHITPAREVCVPVDVATGELAQHGYLSDWIDVQGHPDSNLRFDGITVPAFAACVMKVKQLHRQVPFACCVGWDLAIDADESVNVLEWNAGHNDIKFAEATQGPCFSDLGWQHLLSREHVPMPRSLVRAAGNPR